MKKLLNISVIAALAVLPMAANADPATATEQAPAVTTSNAPLYQAAAEHATDDNLATAGYVKGAYNDAIKAVNKVHATAQAAITDINTNKIGNMAGLTGEATTLVGAIEEVRSAASGDTTAIETKLGAGANGYDINAKSMQVQGDDVLTEDAEQTMTNKTIDADDNTISNIEVDNFKGSAIVDITNDGGLATTVNAASDTALVTEKAVVTAVNAVAGDVADLETDMQTNYATKQGVLATINASTVNVMDTWGGTTPTTVAVHAPAQYQATAQSNNSEPEEPEEPETPGAGD